MNSSLTRIEEIAAASSASPSTAIPSTPGVIPGATLPSRELIETIDAAETAGIDTAFLRAELALRGALIVSCLVLPLLGLKMGMIKRKTPATRLLAKGLAIAALFWLAVAVAWYGATIGFWSSAWIWATVVLGFIVFSVMHYSPMVLKKE